MALELIYWANGGFRVPDPRAPRPGSGSQQSFALAVSDGAALKPEGQNLSSELLRLQPEAHAPDDFAFVSAKM